MSELRQPLWRPSEAGLLGVIVAGGMSCVAAAWWWAADQVAPEHQIAPLNMGVVGGLVVLVGCALFLIVGRHTLALRRRQVVDELDQAVRSARPLRPAVAADGELVGHPDGRYAHRPGCELLDGASVIPVEDGARDRCALCTPKGHTEHEVTGS